MDGLYFEIWAGGRQSTGRSACATENSAAIGGVVASVAWSESKELAGFRRYKGERRCDFVELRWGRRASNFTYFKEE